MNKKGLLYLFISSLFVVIIIIVFLTYKQYSFSDRQKVIETRIITINDFIKDIDFDSKRVIYISGFRSLIAIEDYVATTGAYLANNTYVEELFRIAFYNGTINGTNVSVLENSTYLDYLRQLKIIASRIGINIDINVTNIMLRHDSPWTVNVTVTTHVNITDTKSVAHWEFDKDYSTSVALWNIRDPLYTVSTYGRMPNAIRMSNVTDYVNDSDNTTTGLMTHINNSYYIENPLAPSFLMRLEGNFSSSPFGIESLVNIDELIIQEVNYNSSKSVVDYVLFGNTSDYNNKACNVDNMPSWFKIDLNHTSQYEVNKLNYTIC